MISEGVDINGEDSVYGSTGLMLAMMFGNTEVARILHGCNNIRIDTTNSVTGMTALHYAGFHLENY